MKRIKTLNEEVSRVKALMGLFEEEVISVPRETEEHLVSLFRRIAPKYAKYLTILNFFDPYSLGTISEVILTKLLRDEGVEAENVGGSQGVTDIKIGGSNISLKTTKSGTPIGLGSDTANVTGQDIRDVADFMNSDNFAHLLESGLTLGEILTTRLQTQGPDQEGMDRAMEGLETRIESIIDKISGKENPEEFIWIEKVYDKDHLIQIIVHVARYDRTLVRDEFYNLIPYATKGKSWGLKDESDKVMVQADSSAKKLNINPAFVKKTVSEDKIIPIDIPVKDMKIDDPKDYVSKRMFDALDAMYRELFN